MQSTYVDDQHRDAAPLAPEWPRAVEAESDAAINDDLAGSKPPIVKRMLRALGRFSIAVLIGVGATLVWQSYGDMARELLSTQLPSLRWLSVSTTTVTPDVPRSAQNTTAPQSVPLPQTASSVPASNPESAPLEAMARDLASIRQSLEQLAVRQDQLIQNITTLQAAQQDIKQKISSRAVSQPPSDQQRKPPKPRPQPAQSSPVPAAPPVAQSPAQ